MKDFSMRKGPFSKTSDGLSFRRRRKKVDKKKISRFFLYVAEIAVILSLSFLTAYSFFTGLKMHGQSMEKGIEDNDILLLNKAIYHFRSPKRGDVIAFYPSGNRNSYPSIKRIMGVPGDTIKIEAGYLYINGQEYKGNPKISGIKDPGILSAGVTLGDSEYCVLGDNTKASEDSRFSKIGMIKRSDILGAIWWDATYPRFGMVS